MNKLLKTGQRRWLAIFPLLGLLVLIVLVKLKSPPSLKQDVETSPKVVVEKAQMRELKATISGYGRAQSKETWLAVSEVSGRVIYRHPDLEKGGMLPAGTVALKIDPVDYQLKLAQAKSDLNSAKAEAERIELNKNKMAVSLGLEKNRLEILQKELKRKQGLQKQGSISRSQVDQEQSNVFAQQQKVVDLETNLNLIPNDIEVAQAKIQVAESRLKEAQRALDKTQIVVPFDARIVEVSAEPEQVINQQAVLIKANHIGVMQIPAQFSLSDMRKLIRQSLNGDSLGQEQGFPDIRMLDLQAQIKVYGGEHEYIWDAKVSRISDTIDPQGNTIELIVEMENDWRNFQPLKRPPLLNDMFAQVNISAKPRSVLSVPANAVHGNKAYIVQDGVLRVKNISVMFETEQYAAIDAGLSNTIKVGEQVIVTDLLPAIDGMQVRTGME